MHNIFTAHFCDWYRANKLRVHSCKIKLVKHKADPQKKINRKREKKDRDIKIEKKKERERKKKKRERQRKGRARSYSSNEVEVNPPIDMCACLPWLQIH